MPRVEDPPDSLLILFDDLLDGQLFESSSNWLCTRSTELDVGIVVLLDLRLSVGEVGDVSSGLRVGDNDGDSVGSSVVDSGVNGFSSGLRVGLRVGANDGESVGSSVVVLEMTTGFLVGERVLYDVNEKVNRSHA